MPDFMTDLQDVLWDASHDVSFFILAVVLLLISKLALDLTTPFKVDDQTSAKDNAAFGLSLIGYYLGVTIVIFGASLGEDSDAALTDQLLVMAMWAGLGIALLTASRFILDHIVFPSFSCRKEIVEDKNLGMGAVEFGTYVGSGLVIAGTISGEGGDIVTCLAFFGLGQVGLILCAILYRILTPFDFVKELEADNVAAGTAFAGNSIAVGILMFRGTHGDFVSYEDNIWEFGFYLAAALLLLILGRLLIDGLLLPGTTLTREIRDDRNLNAGFLEGGLLIGFAGLMANLL